MIDDILLYLILLLDVLAYEVHKTHSIREASRQRVAEHSPVVQTRCRKVDEVQANVQRRWVQLKAIRAKLGEDLLLARRLPQINDSDGD